MKESLFRKTSKNIISCLLIIFLCSIIGSLLLGLSYLLPTEPIEANVAKSAEYIENEGSYPHLFYWCTSRLDNSTDSLMLLEACDNTEDSIINKTMLVYYGKTSSNPYDSLVDKYVNHKEFDSKVEYARYWHGYLITLKPLLSIVTYKEIRIINGVIQTLLTAFICFLLLKNKKKQYILPYLLSISMINPICIAYSLQFSTCFYIYSITVITILLMNIKHNNNYLYVFLLSGVLTAFFDFLTYPLVTLGVPLLFTLIINKEDFKTTILKYINYCIVWGMGYGLMWANKWILADIFTNYGVIADAIDQFIFRLGGNNLDSTYGVSRIEAVNTNISHFIETPFTLLVIVFCLIKLYQLVKKREQLNSKYIVIFIVITLLPLLWYFVVSNHSTIHDYFTNKSLIISALSVMFALTYTANKEA